jgi:hypothetical protein
MEEDNTPIPSLGRRKSLVLGADGSVVGENHDSTLNAAFTICVTRYIVPATPFGSCYSSDQVSFRLYTMH